MSREGAKEFRIKLFEVLDGTEFKHLSKARPWCETRASGYRIKLEGIQLRTSKEFYKLKSILDEGFRNQTHAVYHSDFINGDAMADRRMPGTCSGLTIYVAETGKSFPNVMKNAEERQKHYLLKLEREMTQPVTQEAHSYNAIATPPVSKIEKLAKLQAEVRGEYKTDEADMLDVFHKAKADINKRRTVINDATGLFANDIIAAMKQEVEHLEAKWLAIGITL